MSNFRLLNFLEDTQFNGLRFQMNAPLSKDSQATRKIQLLDADLIRALGKEGIDVSLEDINVETDKTLSHKGKRVLVYIRDIPDYGNGDAYKLPRYHLAYCRTLEDMRSKNRWTRYTIANRDTGLFSINFIGQGNRVPSDERLNVCQNCLELLRWEGFSISRIPKIMRQRICSEFKLSDFFEKFPKDLLSIIPSHTSDQAPINTYSDDWGLISEKIKHDRGYKCTECKLELTGINRKFLHVHHENGEKSDNRAKNLTTLCIYCHANKPNHSHMKSSKLLDDFIRQFKP